MITHSSTKCSKQSLNMNEALLIKVSSNDCIARGNRVRIIADYFPETDLI